MKPDATIAAPDATAAPSGHERADGYESRSATVGSMRVARRAGR